MTELHDFIQTTPLMDTHEHLRKEQEYLEHGPDILQDLFGHYPAHDLITAGAAPQAVDMLLDAHMSDLEVRWSGVRQAWEYCQFTGYGEAVRLLAKHAYGIDELNADSIAAANARAAELRRPGERLRILKEVGNIDHVQIDDFVWACLPDSSGLDFFLYDLSWVNFCNGEPNLDMLHTETGVRVSSLETLREGMAALFEAYGPCAIAVKAQHAYNRTLLWQERSDADAARALHKIVHGDEVTEEDRLCLGDWCWARGVELAIKHDLPFKIHTGYYAGNANMPVERIKPGHLCGLLKRYPHARFILMHIAYPYQEELIAVAKHYPNVYIDLCWAWSINPYSAADFVRRLIHAVPINKLFAFGGDTSWPNASVTYANQARAWLERALQGEIGDGYMNEAQAIAIAARLMRGNQIDCFDLEGTRAAIHEAYGKGKSL